MILKYETSKYVKEFHEIDIPDPKNVFLKGTNPYDGLNTYFGIWCNNEYLVIVTIISNRCISYEYSRIKSIYTEININKYLENNKNVKLISKESFKEQLDKFKLITEM